MVFVNFANWQDKANLSSSDCEVCDLTSLKS